MKDHFGAGNFDVRAYLRHYGRIFQFASQYFLFKKKLFPPHACKDQ